MTFDEYQKAALRTASMGLGADVEMCVRALGLVGEAVEFAESLGSTDEVELKEAGDVLWYTAALAHMFGIGGHSLQLEALSDVSRCYYQRSGCAAETIISAAGHLAEMVKKQVGHKKPADKARVIHELQVIVTRLATALPDDYDLGDVAELNVAKLLARYPAGFDVAIASKKPDETLKHVVGARADHDDWKSGPV